MFHSPLYASDAEKILIFDEIASILTRTVPPDNVNLLTPQHAFLRDRSLHFNGSILDLASKPLSLSLITALVEAKDFSMARNELVEKIYDVNINTISNRMFESKTANLVKLVSRTRTLCKLAFGDDKIWLVFDGKRWKLFS